MKDEYKRELKELLVGLLIVAICFTPGITLVYTLLNRLGLL